MSDMVLPAVADWPKAERELTVDEKLDHLREEVWLVRQMARLEGEALVDLVLLLVGAPLRYKDTPAEVIQAALYHCNSLTCLGVEYEWVLEHTEEINARFAREAVSEGGE